MAGEVAPVSARGPVVTMSRFYAPRCAFSATQRTSSLLHPAFKMESETQVLSRTLLQKLLQSDASLRETKQLDSSFRSPTRIVLAFQIPDSESLILD